MLISWILTVLWLRQWSGFWLLIFGCHFHTGISSGILCLIYQQRLMMKWKSVVNFENSAIYLNIRFKVGSTSLPSTWKLFKIKLLCRKVATPFAFKVQHEYCYRALIHKMATQYDWKLLKWLKCLFSMSFRSLYIDVLTVSLRKSLSVIFVQQLLIILTRVHAVTTLRVRNHNYFQLYSSLWTDVSNWTFSRKFGNKLFIDLYIYVITTLCELVN